MDTELLVDVLADACLDSLKLLPFLFVTYVFMEWLEHGAGKKFEHAIARAGRIGPVLGSLLGVIPQCGFSGAAATLYAGRVITLGTVIAVFMATSDEMLPIMISESFDPGTIAKVLAIKVVAGMAVGLLLDAALSRSGRLHTGFSSDARHKDHGHNDIRELCEREGCDCEDNDDEESEYKAEHGHEHHEHSHDESEHVGASILMPALRHTLNVMVFIFLVTLALNFVMEAGFEHVIEQFTASPVTSTVVVGLFGFIPNCAVSVAITELYLEGLLAPGALICGLCVNAGIGLLVLFRTNRDPAENIKIMAFLYVASLLVGGIVQTCGVL